MEPYRWDFVWNEIVPSRNAPDFDATLIFIWVDLQGPGIQNTSKQYGTTGN